MPDKQRNHQRIGQRGGGAYGQIEAADGQGYRYADSDHRHDGDRSQDIDDVKRVEEVVRCQTKNGDQQDDGQQHAPFVEKIEKSLTARYRRVNCQGFTHAAAPPVE